MVSGSTIKVPGEAQQSEVGGTPFTLEGHGQLMETQIKTVAEASKRVRDYWGGIE